MVISAKIINQIFTQMTKIMRYIVYIWYSSKAMLQALTGYGQKASHQLGYVKTTCFYKIITQETGHAYLCNSTQYGRYKHSS